MFNAKKFKKHQAIVWGELASTYDASFSTIMYPAGLKMIEDARVAPGDRVLDLGCGTGTDTLMAAARVGPQGQVVGIDLAPRMVERAREKAHERTANVSFDVMDAEELAFDSSSFDAVISKFALPIFPDCHRALEEVRRVLRPGGRLAVLVLGRPEHNQFLTVAAKAAARHLPSLVTHDEGGPSDFQFGAEGALEAAFNAAGFTEARSRRYVAMVTCTDGASFYDLFANGAGNFSYKLKQLDQITRKTVFAEIVNTAERYQSPDGIRLPMEVVVGYAEKPGAGGTKDAAHVPPPKSFGEFLRVEAADVPQMSSMEAVRAVMNGEIVVVDVRARTEYARGRIPKSLNAPRGLLEQLIGTLVATDETRPLLVCSDDGTGGALACQALLSMGYRNARNLEGGFEAWRRSGGPVES